MKTDSSPNSAHFTGDWPGSDLTISMLSTFRTNTVYGNCREFLQFHQGCHWFLFVQQMFKSGIQENRRYVTNFRQKKSYTHSIRIRAQEAQSMFYSILVHTKDSRYRCVTVSVTHRLVGEHLAQNTSFT